MRTFLSIVMLVSSLVAFGGAQAPTGSQPLLGRWNLTGTGPDAGAIFWLELTQDNGQLAGRFLNRGGSPVKLASVEVKGNELVFQTAGANNQPGQTFRAHLDGGRLVGEAALANRTLAFVGVRPPVWPPADANAAHTFGKPVALVDGKTLDAWTFQRTDRPSGWSVVDGAMTNEKGATNLVSKEKFKDFRVEAEYKLEAESNSGLYLRGRYELQILDDAGKPTEAHGHMAIYAWVAPLVNASKPAGEWQTVQATLVSNRVTVVLNGQKVQDNARIEAITGGALDANEDQPGPIMLQGDHGKVWFRKVTVTPIVKAGS